MQNFEAVKEIVRKGLGNTPILCAVALDAIEKAATGDRVPLERLGDDTRRYVVDVCRNNGINI